VFRQVRIHAVEWVLLAVCISLFVVFSFTPKTSPRYYLPCAVACSYFAVMGVFAFLQCILKASKFSMQCHALLSLALLIPLLARERAMLESRFEGFANDDRKALVQYIQNHLPASAVIAQDEAVNLPEPERRPEHKGLSPLIQMVRGKKQLADMGTVTELRAQGVTHVAICNRTFARFLASGDSPEKRFYEEVMKRGRELFVKPPGIITYLQPGLRFIDISAL
jgi:hypothetical protein